MIISILKLTKKGAVEQERVNKDAAIPDSIGQKLLQKLQCSNLIYLERGKVNTDTAERLHLAIRAIELGADIERVSGVLDWKEFEALTGIALTRSGYEVCKNVRFQNVARRWEIDVVGCKEPFVICVECKRWRYGLAPAKLEKIVDNQIDRVHALADVLPEGVRNLPVARWEHAKFFPVVLSLIPSRFKFWNNVPVVPVLQFQDFINQMPLYASSLKFFSRRFQKL
jgi:Holliday junction resolvase-like predicted endonuclease